MKKMQSKDLKSALKPLKLQMIHHYNFNKPLIIIYSIYKTVHNNHNIN